LDRSGIRIASYLTDLPPQAVLRRKLHDAIERAQARRCFRYCLKHLSDSPMGCRHRVPGEWPLGNDRGGELRSGTGSGTESIENGTESC
jgi:hypothetical protein